MGAEGHARGERWRLPLWLTILALGAAALWASMGTVRRSEASVASVRPAEGASLLEPPAGDTKAPPRPPFKAPLQVSGEPPPAPAPAPDPAATAWVSGRVVDALGGPIVGALVSAFSEPATPPLASMLTNSSGRFELRAPPGPVRVIAQADAYSTTQQRAVAPAGDLTLALAPASRIFGRVLDGRGAAVSGSVVRARTLARLDPIVSSALTDAQGLFRFEALAAGEYELRATGERLSGEPARVALGVADEAGPLELRVTAAVRVALEVERGGRACAGGWVQLAGERFQGARELAEGRVLFEAVPPGDYQLGLGCEAAAFQNRELHVGDADLEERVRLDPGQRLAGRVLNAAGAGVPGMLVTLAPRGLPAGRAYMTCRSGPGGAFACDGLSAGGYRCRAGLELQPQSDPVDVLVVDGAPPVPIELRLWPRAALVVSLDDAPPERLSSVRVSARPEQGPPLDGELRGGEFHFDGLLLGRYEVYLAASPATRREVLLSRDGQREAVSLPWPRARAIAGVVLDERRQPVVDVWVRATAEGDSRPFAGLSEVGVPGLTDSEGRFSVEGLFEGGYHLRVEQLGREGFASSVPSGTEDVVIHLAPREPHDRAGSDTTEGSDSHDSSSAPGRTVQRASFGAPQQRKREQL